MVVAKKWLLAHHFQQEAKFSDFELVEEEITDHLNEGEFLVEAVYISVDPYMRPYAPMVLTEGDTMIAEQIARVLTSENTDFPVGCYVIGHLGWRTHTLATKEIQNSAVMGVKLRLLPSMDDLPTSLGLGILGMTGMSAYFGFLEICQPKAGETVLVNSAAGSIGIAVGQIAKIKGCKVIGSAGSKAKCDWLKSDLGFDDAFNYKDVSVDEALDKMAPEGIDCFFDNVGTHYTSAVIPRMNKDGRISFCGSISSYNTDYPDVPCPWGYAIFRELTLRGFIVYRWKDQFSQAVEEMKEWIKQGKLKYRETITEGFENMPAAFLSLFTGENTGKAVVKI